MAKIKEEARTFSVRFPVSLIEEIEQLCSSNYISKTSWLIRAAKEKIEKERITSTERLIKKIAKIEDEN